MDLNISQTQEELLGFSMDGILRRHLQEDAISTWHIYSLQNIHCLLSNLLCIINLFITYFPLLLVSLEHCGLKPTESIWTPIEKVKVQWTKLLIALFYIKCLDYERSHDLQHFSLMKANAAWMFICFVFLFFCTYGWCIVYTATLSVAQTVHNWITGLWLRL
jgi:hypothetical protein